MSASVIGRRPNAFHQWRTKITPQMPMIHAGQKYPAPPRAQMTIQCGIDHDVGDDVRGEVPPSTYAPFRRLTFADNHVGVFVVTMALASLVPVHDCLLGPAMNSAFHEPECSPRVCQGRVQGHIEMAKAD
jgi:hypothetical protein